MSEYYIPKLKEFHLGFEYEYWGHFGEEFGKWVQKKVDLNTRISLIKDLMATGSIRVKCLDTDNIKSLGFDQISDDCFNLSIKEYRGGLNQEVRILIKETILIYLAMDMNYDDKDNLVLFTGIIKNKSKLRELLTEQLEIINE